MFQKLSCLLNSCDLHLDVMYPGRVYLSSQIRKWSEENRQHYIQSYSSDIILSKLSSLKPTSVCLWLEDYPPSRSLAEYLAKTISEQHGNIRIILADVCFNCIDEALESAVYWENRASDLPGIESNVFYFDEVPLTLNLLFSNVTISSIVLPLVTTSAKLSLGGRITYAVNIIRDIFDFHCAQSVDAACLAGMRIDRSLPLDIAPLYEKCVIDHAGGSGGGGSIGPLVHSLRYLVRLYMLHESSRRFSIMLNLVEHDAIDILCKEFHVMGYRSLPYSLSSHPEYLANRVFLDPGSHGIASRYTQRSVEGLLNAALPVPIYSISDISLTPYKSIVATRCNGAEVDILDKIRQSSLSLDRNIELLSQISQCVEANIIIGPPVNLRNYNSASYMQNQS